MLRRMVIVDLDRASLVVEVDNVLVNAVLLGEIDTRPVSFDRFERPESL